MDKLQYSINIDDKDFKLTNKRFIWSIFGIIGIIGLFAFAIIF